MQIGHKVMDFSTFFIAAQIVHPEAGTIGTTKGKITRLLLV
jgi:hypothetical protein